MIPNVLIFDKILTVFKETLIYQILRDRFGNEFCLVIYFNHKFAIKKRLK